MNMDWHRTGHA